MKTKTWVVRSIEVKPSENGLSNVAKKINWHRAIWEVFDGKDYFVSTEGSIDLPSANPASFIQYDDLKPEDVSSWLEANLDVNQIDADLEAALEQKKNPPLVKLELPWIGKTNIVESVVI